MTPRQWPDPAPGRRAYNLDPSGRDVPLFMRRRRPPDWDEWRSALEWELPAPMRCRVLGHAEYVLGEGEVDAVRTSPALPPAVALAASLELAPFIGTRFPSETALRELVATLPSSAAILNVAVFRPLLQTALVADCGKAALLPDPDRDRSLVGAGAGGGGDHPAHGHGGRPALDVRVQPGRQAAGDRSRAGALPAHRRARRGGHRRLSGGVRGAVRRRRLDRADSLRPATVPVITGGGAIAAAAIAVAGVTSIGDSASYTSLPDLNGVADLTLQAANRQRPFLRLDAAHAA